MERWPTRRYLNAIAEYTLAYDNDNRKDAAEHWANVAQELYAEAHPQADAPPEPDINIHMQEVDPRKITELIRRELRRGTARLM